MATEGVTGGPTVVRRRGRTAVVVTLAVLALAAAGAAGIAYGRSTAPGPSIVVVPGPVAEETPASGVIPTGAPSGAPSLVVAAHPVAIPAIFSPAAGLGDSPTTASGYRLVRGGVDGRSLAASLAAAFGIDGQVAQSNEGWSVGPPDSSTATLSVRDDAALDWSMTDPLAAAASVNGVYVDPSIARDIASGLLGSIGVDVVAVDWQVDRTDAAAVVTAWQLVDTVRTGLLWQVSIGKDGAVVDASGFAADLEEVPGYDVVGAATAVRRSSLPTWRTIGPTSLGSPLPASALPSVPSAAGPSGRPALQVPTASVVVTSAVLGRGLFWQPDGELLILPAYELGGGDGSRWTLIAVSGDYVDFVGVPYPTPSPTAS